jgi:hypothetical protein
VGEVSRGSSGRPGVSVGSESKLARRSLTHRHKSAPRCARYPLSYPGVTKLDPFCLPGAKRLAATQGENDTGYRMEFHRAVLPVNNMGTRGRSSFPISSLASSAFIFCSSPGIDPSLAFPAHDLGRADSGPPGASLGLTDVYLIQGV